MPAAADHSHWSAAVGMFAYPPSDRKRSRAWRASASSRSSASGGATSSSATAGSVTSGATPSAQASRCVQRPALRCLTAFRAAAARAVSPPAAFRAAAAHTAEPLPRSGRALVAAVVGLRRSATAGVSMRRVCGRSTLPTRHQRGTVYERLVSAARSGGRTLPVPARDRNCKRTRVQTCASARAFCLR